MVIEELLVQRAGARSVLSQKPCSAPEFSGRQPAIVDGRIIGCGDAHDLVFEQRLSDKPLVGGRPAEDSDIDPVTADAVEHPLPIADVEREPDPGMLIGERAHQRWNERFRGGRDRDDPNTTGGDFGRLTRGLSPRRQQPDHVRGVRKECGSGAGQAHPSTRPCEQLTAKLSTESLDGGGHRRLGDHQGIRRSCDRAALDHGQKTR